jgi:hypoxanthine phosphoribosyltransferase
MTYDINNDIERILMSEKDIEEAVTRISAEIDKYYANRDSRLLLLGILKGSVVFMGDLMKHITLPVEIDFMRVSSYGNTTTSKGRINILLDLYRSDFGNTDILIVEDIIDSGKTLSYLVEYLKLKGAKSVKTCTLLDKPDRREVDFEADWVGKIIPNEFVVGYGLDFDEKYRALPYVGILKPSVYEN